MARPLAILLLWQAASSFGWLSRNVPPSPLGVLQALWKLTLSGELARNIGVSFLRATAGFVIGGGIGSALGLANGLSKTSEILTDSTLQMVRNIPHLALIPLVILWFRHRRGSKAVPRRARVFFPVYINTLHGVRSVDPQLIEMGRSGMSRTDLFRRVILPKPCPRSSSGFASRSA